MKDLEGKGERLNAVISLSAKRSLERLAFCYGVTQRAVLNRIIAEAEASLLTGLTSREQSAYFEKQLQPHDSMCYAVTDREHDRLTPNSSSNTTPITL